MKYDFDTVCDRKNTSCVKWDTVGALFGSDDVIPMWVADMDFPIARPITDALIERARHECYGYTRAGESVVESVVDRMQRKFGWKIEPEWVVFTPGVIPALNVAIRAFTRPGDEIVLQEPVYYPFFPAVTNAGCQIANNGLILEDGRYVMDYDDLERKFAPRVGMGASPGRVKALVLCNPQNPVGRLWNREEITRMGEIVIGNGGLVLSDEIHCEIRYPGITHTPFASISEEFAQNSIVFMAPSKSFNLAGLSSSSIIIPNKKLRDAFNATARGVMPGPNVFGFIAMEAAYRYGDEWLEQFLDYLNGNLEFLLKYFEEKIPEIRVIRPEGTYLVWLDCRALDMEPMALRSFMREKAKVGFDDGFLFGAGAEGFQRMNIACPRVILEEALQRIERAVDTIRK